MQKHNVRNQKSCMACPYRGVLKTFRYGQSYYAVIVRTPYSAIRLFLHPFFFRFAPFGRWLKNMIWIWITYIVVAHLACWHAIYAGSKKILRISTHVTPTSFLSLFWICFFLFCMPLKVKVIQQVTRWIIDVSSGRRKKYGNLFCIVVWAEELVETVCCTVYTHTAQQRMEWFI